MKGKLPTFSSVGREDVDLGAMLGTSTFDVDKKIAEATSFNIHGVLHGAAVKNEKIPFTMIRLFSLIQTQQKLSAIPPR